MSTQTLLPLVPPHGENQVAPAQPSKLHAPHRGRGKARDDIGEPWEMELVIGGAFSKQKGRLDAEGEVEALAWVPENGVVRSARSRREIAILDFIMSFLGQLLRFSPE